MKKKLLGLMISMLLLGMCLAGCGEAAGISDEQENAEPQTLHVYTFDEQLGNSLEYVWNKHPEWKDRIELIVIEPEQYAETIEEGLVKKEKINEDGTEVKCPDLFVADIGDLARFTANEKVVPVSELGIGDADFQQMYSYTVDMAKIENNVKALTWMVTPGAFVYRKSFAEEYLGSSDVKDVQSYLKAWDTFCDTAVNISRKSEGKVKMLASVHEIDKVFASNRTEAWMNNEKPVIDKSYDRLLDTSLYLTKNSFVLNKEIGTADYLRAAAGDQVFGFFATSDFIINELSDSCGGTSGDWAVCAGPQSFIDGGQWILVSEKCGDKELASNIIRTLCFDQSTLKSINEQENVFVNNLKVMSNAYNSNKGKLDVLGGDDYIKEYDKQAQAAIITVDPEKEILDSLFFELDDNYINGKIKKEEFYNLFEQEADKLLHPEPSPVVEEVTE